MIALVIAMLPVVLNIRTAVKESGDNLMSLPGLEQAFWLVQDGSNNMVQDPEVMFDLPDGWIGVSRKYSTASTVDMQCSQPIIIFASQSNLFPKVTQGNWPNPGQVLIDETIKDSCHVEIGGQLEVSSIELEVSGFVKGTAGAGGSGVYVTMQDFTGISEPGKGYSLGLTLDPDLALVTTIPGYTVIAHENFMDNNRGYGEDSVGGLVMTMAGIIAFVMLPFYVLTMLTMSTWLKPIINTTRDMGMTRGQGRMWFIVHNVPVLGTAVILAQYLIKPNFVYLIDSADPMLGIESGFGQGDIAVLTLVLLGQILSAVILLPFPILEKVKSIPLILGR